MGPRSPDYQLINMIPETLRKLVPGHRHCIVSLCYDDGLTSHHAEVAPLLGAHGLRATFYPHLQGRFLGEIPQWRTVAAAGHEIGNHTIFHPCYDQKWLDRTYHLRHYSPQRWKDEIQVANAVLRSVDRCTQRTFGNTCHDNIIGEGDKIDRIDVLAQDHFIAARGVHTRRPVDFDRLNWYNLGNRGIDGCRFAELQPELESLLQAGGWLLLTIHGVGPQEHSLNLPECEHRRLLEWLAVAQEQVWVAPVRTVAQALRQIPEQTEDSAGSSA